MTDDLRDNNSARTAAVSSQEVHDKKPTDTPKKWDEALLIVIWHSKWRRVWLSLVCLVLFVSIILNFVPPEKQQIAWDYVFPRQTPLEQYLKNFHPLEIRQVDDDETFKAQLALEHKLVRANHLLRLDYAFLRMADDDNRPMADSLVTRAANRLTKLGFVADMVRDADGDVLNQTQKLRAYLIQEALLALKGREMQVRSDLIFGVSGKRPPKCHAGMREALPFLNELSENQRVIAEINYESYKKACTEALETRWGLIGEGGEIRSANNDWRAAQKKHMDLQRAIGDQSKKVAAAKAAYAQVVKQAGAEGAETQREIQDAATKLSEALETAGDSSALIGILPEARIKALTTILLAIASQRADDQVKTEKINTATLIAGQIPTIAGQIKDMWGTGQAPSLSALLIELRHQSNLLDYAKEQQELVRRSARLHEERYKAYEREARQWLSFHDALCSYAVTLAGGMHPGKNCDAFVVTLEKKNGKDVADCSLSGKRIPASGDCALAMSWKASLANVPSDRTAKREFYKALAAFSLAMVARAPQDEYEYSLVDLSHQEIIAANRSAIAAWQNLVKVSLNQISALNAATTLSGEAANVSVANQVLRARTGRRAIGRVTGAIANAASDRPVGVTVKLRISGVGGCSANSGLFGWVPGLMSLE